MKTILYIHGFNSAGNTAKAESLRELFSNEKVISPSFNYKDFDGVIKQLHSTFIINKVNVVVGTSLGGFLSIYASCKYGIPAVAINPVTQPSQTLVPMIGENKNFVTKERYVLTEHDIEKYQIFEKKVFDKLVPKDDKIAFILSNDDELLGDHHYLEQLYPMCHNFKYFEGQGHRFASMKPIKAQIEAFL